MKYNCLIIDDEEDLAEATSEYFNLFDIKTSYVTNESDCKKFLKENEVDLLLLDINLKETSGFSLCKNIRQTSNIPILFISARQSDNDIITALSIGGDDYIKKPYNLNVLLAKVKIILKRLCSSNDNSSINEDNIYEKDNLKIDYTSGKVYINDLETPFKALEYKLLTYFIKNKGRIINKEELFQNVWKDSFTGDGTLNVHVRHIREKIEKDPTNPAKLKTIWGRGYIYED